MNTKRRVLVTGSTGFIGRHVVAALPGCDVTAVLRDGVAPPGVSRTIRIGTLDGATDWTAALDGIDAVIHLAGIAHRPARSPADEDAYAAVNTRGTLRLAEAAEAAGVRDFVFASSIAVHGTNTEGRGPFRESDPLLPAGPYGASKARAEDGLAALAARSAMAVTALRPPLVHGRGAPGNIARLEAAIRRGVPLPLASVRNRRAFLGVANLADFVAWRLGRANHGYEPFILADAAQPATPEFVRLLAAAMDRRVRLVPFPPAILRRALVASGREAMAEGLLASLEVDTGKVEAAGWRPPLGLAEGLRAAWRPAQSTVA
ncbi:MAG: NAD-dependent epimerase/dehydratase family protein [Rhizobiales bacterium]|nr:NAD-dependent epimerase/dehydratase family protein [Hyphomicrobiales bacterium]